MYDQFYGFSGRPFQLAPDPEFYFESLTHRKALSYLGYGLSQGEGFIVITGEVGAGKSTLAAHLVASIDRQRLTVGQIVTSQLDGGELVRLATQAFGITLPVARAPDKAAALGALEGFLQDEARAGRRCLLIVDEAQNLQVAALEELRMLSNFQLGAHPLLQILLLGQPEFRATLNEPGLEQLRQRVIATHHLDAMEPDEVGRYVEHRLTHVGWQGNPAFGEGVHARLAEASGCVPRRINLLANRLLLAGSVDRVGVLDTDMLDDVIADLAGDLDTVRPSAHEPTDVAPAAPEPTPEPVQAAPAPAAESAAIMADLAHEMALRDEQIAELQHAVMELADMRGGPAPVSAPEPDLEPVLSALVDLTRRIELLETRTGDQNEAIRHVLTMLIEWLEAENAHVRAA
jgi:putative secretion ATPase (PEP-CTERM system associated)